MSTLQTTNLKHPDAVGNQITFTSGGDINLDNGAVYIDSTNSRLGIGTTTPARPLHLRASTNPMLLLESSDSIADIIGADTSGSTRFRSDAGAISFWTGGDASDASATNSNRALTIDTDARLLVGASSARTDFYGSNGFGVQVEGLEWYNSGISAVCNDSVYGGYFALGRSRGSTLGSQTIVQDDDTLGSFDFLGADGTKLVHGARIRAQVDGTPDVDNMPTRLFFMTNSGTTSPTERMSIDSTGIIKQVGEYSLHTALYTGEVTDNGNSGTGTFDVTFVFPDSNNFMIVEILGYHRAYSGTQEYYRFMASHRTVNNLYNHNILDDLTSTGSITQTNTSVTFTGRRPRSNTGTSINSTVRVIYRGMQEPTSVTIANS